MEMSHKTAIYRQNPSAPARWLDNKGLIQGRSLDFGCGRGKDANIFSMAAYDPHFNPKLLKGLWDTILCTYVLNVVPIREANKIIRKIKKLLRPTGMAYITVRRDIKEDTKTQRVVKLNLPIVYRNSNYIIYKIEG